MPGSVTRALIPKTPPQRRNPSLPHWGCARGFTQAALISGQPSTGSGSELGAWAGSKAEGISITESPGEGRPGLIHSPLPAVFPAACGVGGRVTIHPQAPNRTPRPVLTGGAERGQ